MTRQTAGVGIEPTTIPLTAERSASELPSNINPAYHTSHILYTEFITMIDTSSINIIK